MSPSKPVRDPLRRWSFGPWPYCQALLWEQLVDFPAWVDWLPAVRAVNRLDGGSPGRGSRLQVDKAFHSEIWEITHWNRQQRLDFEIANPHCRAGFSIRLFPDCDENHATLQLDSEFTKGHNGLVLAWLARRRLEAFATHWIQAFADCIRAQRPPLD